MSGAEWAGRLAQRVIIERRIGARDDLGATDAGWDAVAVRWAEVTPDRHGDAVAGEAASALPRYRVTLRGGVSIEIGDRLVWRGRRLRVRTHVVDPSTPDRILLSVEEER